MYSDVFFPWWRWIGTLEHKFMMCVILFLFVYLVVELCITLAGITPSCVLLPPTCTSLFMHSVASCIRLPSIMYISYTALYHVHLIHVSLRFPCHLLGSFMAVVGVWYISFPSQCPMHQVARSSHALTSCSPPTGSLYKTPTIYPLKDEAADCEPL